MWQATRAEAPASKPTCYCHCATYHLQPYSPLSSDPCPKACTAAGERGAAVARLGQALCHTRLRPAADWVHEAATALRSTGAEAEAPGAVPELRTPSASNLCTGHSNKPGRLGLKHLLYRRHQGVVDGNGYQQHTSISQVTQHMQFSLAGSCAANKCMRSQCPQTCALPVVNATANRHLRHWTHSLAAQHTNTVETQRWAPQHMTPNLQEQRQTSDQSQQEQQWQNVAVCLVCTSRCEVYQLGRALGAFLCPFPAGLCL